MCSQPSTLLPYTYDCTPAHLSNTIIKFADDTTVTGLITEGDEQQYREEIEGLTLWCQKNNLELNTTKTKKLIVHFRKKQQTETLPLLINGTCVERVNTFKFLGVHISDQLTWTFITTAIIKKNSAESPLPGAVEKEQPGGEAVGGFLELCYRMFFKITANCNEVDKKGAAESDTLCREDHWVPPALTEQYCLLP